MMSRQAIYILDGKSSQTNRSNMQSLLKPIIGPKKEIHDLSGRVALVTGGALGIG